MKRVVQVAIAVIVVTTLAGLLMYRPEPSYQGKSLSDWVVAMNDERDNGRAHQAVRHLGTNSIPLLLDWLRRDERPTLRGRFIQLKLKVDDWLVRCRIIKSHPILVEFDFKSNYRALAMAALPVLGPGGKPAIPVLIQMLGEKKGQPAELSETAGAAYAVLGKMAPDSIRPLIGALSGHDVQVYVLAAGALGNIGPEADAAIPVLRQKLNDKTLRFCAADTIGKLGGDPEEFMPALVEGFREGDWDARSFVLGLLTRYKEHAKSAAPVLIEVLKNNPETGDITNKTFRDEIISTLKQIDPEAPLAEIPAVKNQ